MSEPPSATANPLNPDQVQTLRSRIQILSLVQDHLNGVLRGGLAGPLGPRNRGLLRRVKASVDRRKTKALRRLGERG